VCGSDCNALGFRRTVKEGWVVDIGRCSRRTFPTGDFDKVCRALVSALAVAY
jgi:hypothetical protein